MQFESKNARKSRLRREREAASDLERAERAREERRELDELAAMIASELEYKSLPEVLAGIIKGHYSR